MLFIMIEKCTVIYLLLWVKLNVLGRRSSSICQKGLSFPDQGLFIHYGGWARGKEALEEVAKELKKVTRRKVGEVIVDRGAEGREQEATSWR